MKKKIYWGILVLFLNGCASITAQSYYPEGQFPATDFKSVKIFRAVPPRPHAVIGEAYIDGSEYMDNADKDELKKKIAEIGGDAAVPDCKETIIPEETIVEIDEDYFGKLTGKTTERYPARTDWTCSHSSYKIIRFDEEGDQ